MKKFQLIALILSVFSSASFGQTKKLESIYTSLSDKACKTIESTSEEGGSYRGMCKGIGGFNLELLEGDLRQSVNVIAPNKKKYELNLWSVVSSGFSALGEKAEWRVTRNGKTITPVALILRYNVSENPEDSTKNTSYLVIAKITKNSACVTDVVKPMVNQNVKAQKLAETAANKPCMTSE